MSEQDNNIFPGCWQVILVAVLLAGSLVFCAYAVDIRITTTPPKTVPAPAPTATLSPLYVILIEQAKASARVQVITAEAEAESRATWDAALVGLLFFVPLFIGGLYWLKREGGSYG